MSDTVVPTIDQTFGSIGGQVYITFTDADLTGWCTVIEAFAGTDGKLQYVVLSDGTVINWDHVISVRPATRRY